MTKIRAMIDNSYFPRLVTVNKKNHTRWEKRLFEFRVNFLKSMEIVFINDFQHANKSFVTILTPPILFYSII